MNTPFEVLPFQYLFPAFILILVIRYFLASGSVHLLCYVANRRRWHSKKINPKFVSSQMIRSEIQHSLSSSVVFALGGCLILLGWEAGWTQIYLEWDQYGWAYLPISLAIYLFLHETYFYWTHRWMHHPKLFRHFHKVHHYSTNPTPWTSFSFELSESFVEALIIPVLVLWIPIHPAVLVCFLSIMTVSGVLNHTGYELFPRGFARGFLGRWWITATHHYQHHSKSNSNYGLYFTFWDRWMGTHDSGYEALYDEVTSRELKRKSVQ